MPPHYEQSLWYWVVRIDAAHVLNKLAGKTRGFNREWCKLKWSLNFGFKNTLIGNSTNNIPVKLQLRLCSEYVSVYSSIFSPKLLLILISYFQGEQETVWFRLSVPTESHNDGRRLYCSPFSFVACGEISPLLGFRRPTQFLQFFIIIYSTNTSLHRTLSISAYIIHFLEDKY
jgi:hypothetical protein